MWDWRVWGTGTRHAPDSQLGNHKPFFSGASADNKSPSSTLLLSYSSTLLLSYSSTHLITFPPSLIIFSFPFPCTVPVVGMLFWFDLVFVKGCQNCPFLQE